MSTLASQAIALLQSLIATPSFSREEEKTAGLIDRFLKDAGVATHRKGHNIWAFNRHYDENKPNVLLNSHHDTVKPAKGWTRGPFAADLEDGTLYGLGSNDAGGPLVSLIATFFALLQTGRPALQPYPGRYGGGGNLGREWHRCGAPRTAGDRRGYHRGAYADAAGHCRARA